jgi:homoserine kinase type II
MADMDLDVLLQAWALPEPRRCLPLANGTNNVVYRVETPGSNYVLRVYSNHADPARVRFEQSVLTQLGDAALPFAVPAPIPTHDGALFARTTADGADVLATLTALIPGQHPRGDCLEQAAMAGEALGMLDVALQRIVPPDPADALSWRSYGDLAHCHPLVPDPLAAIEELTIPDEVRTQLLEHCAWLLEHIAQVYTQLPQQPAYEDCGPDNMLMDGPRVTGILDFEFCALDVRPMDLTVALTWWPGDRFGTGAEWPIISAFAHGYARHIHLTPHEVGAIPVLFELRAYTSLIHRLGRYRQGLSSLGAVTARAFAALERADWLAANGAHLAEELREVFAG